MLASVKKMISASEAGKDHAKAGNHRMERLYDGTIAYYYHDTAICVVSRGQVEYNNGGWNTTSTSRAINSYKSYYGEGK